MPKKTKTINVGSHKEVIRITGKLRIGDRKNGLHAHQMSTEDLQKALENPNVKRHRNKIERVLRQRGAL